MNQSIRVEQAQKNKRLIALLIDLVILTVSTLAVFFVSLYGIFGQIYHYNDKVSLVSKYQEDYQLTLKEGEDYTKYEAIVQNFYFEYFPNEIINSIETNYPNEHYQSIIHVYNVYVLNLPYNPEPTGDKYKSDLFEYQIDKETGAVLVNEIGIKRDDLSGDVYDRYLRELMYTKYNKLEGMLYSYMPDYQEAKIYKNNLELTSRTVAAGLSVIIFIIVIPLCLKNGQTIGDKICDVAYATNKGGFRIKPYHTIIRAFGLYTLPVIGVALFDKYAIAALVIFPIFISTLLILLRQSERDFRDLVSGTIAVDKKNSLLFKSIGEARVYEKKEENQIIEDKEYLDRLQNASQVDLSTTRDEQFKNRNKKN